jgi:hypothetical protein
MLRQRGSGKTPANAYLTRLASSQAQAQAQPQAQAQAQAQAQVWAQAQAQVWAQVWAQAQAQAQVWAQAQAQVWAQVWAQAQALICAQLICAPHGLLFLRTSTGCRWHNGGPDTTASPLCSCGTTCTWPLALHTPYTRPMLHS